LQVNFVICHFWITVNKVDTKREGT